MATNLISLIMDYLTPELIGRIASALGLDRNNASAAIGASVPALLAGICGAATQPGGAQKLLDSAKQQTGALDKFSSMIGGDNAGLIDKGSQMLSSLFSSQQQTALAGAVGKFSGLNTGTGSSLLGMLAPVIMGTIAGQPAARGGDASALGSLLASQKDNIAKAMPPGFSNLLSGTGLLEKFGMAGTATAAAGEATRAASSTARAVSTAGQRAAGAATSSGIPSWLFWLLGAIAAALVAWFLVGNFLVGNRTQPVAEQNSDATQSMVVDGVNIRTQLGDSLAGLRTTLEGVTDADSARAALPKLQGVVTQFDNVAGLVRRLSPDQRKIASGLVSTLMPTLNQLFDKVLALPGVSIVLKPTIDAVKASLATITE
jgi:uncharacterized protein DUF937